MSLTLVGVLAFILFLILIFLEIPVGYSMLFIGFWGICYIRSFSAGFEIVASDIISTVTSYSLSVIPMFVFMGFIAFRSGIGEGLFNTAYKFIGHYRGGLALATQIACGLFGAVCGSVAATIATIGSIAHPEMKKYNYADKLSTASIAAGSSLGSLIPPSVLFMIYGIATEQSIGKLFLAGILPGILLMVLFMINIVILTRLDPNLAPAGPKASWKERIDAIRNGLIEILAVFIISLGGLFAGWFTPTEAGAVGAISLLIVSFLRKKIDWNGTKEALLDTTKLTAMIYILLIGAKVFGRFFALTRIPFELGSWVAGLELPAYLIMATVILVYLLLGCVIDGFALILLTVPIFYPLVVTTLGYDPIWFGVIIVLVVCMGAITPPVGLGAYIMKGIAPEVPLEEIFRGSWTFVVAMVVCIAILIAFPQIATVIPYMSFK